ncbi:MAG: hypothetical protein WDZ42_00825 [Candidatus Saccharimonadales bacterium]
MNKHIFDHQAWGEMTIFEQMGNIGSEVGRALAAKKQGDEDKMMAAFYRGIDLIDETVELWSSQNKPGLKELLLAKEQFAESILTDQKNSGIEQYFMNFAIAARITR